MSYNYLEDLESRSIGIIREAYWEHKGRIALLWSMGKDSTTLVHLARKAFFSKLPFPVIHIDTGYKFKQIYDFRRVYAKRWGLKLLVAKNKDAVKDSVSPDTGRFECCTRLKTDALKKAINRYGFRALLVAIRRDEHTIRAKERYFSSRNSSFGWDYRNQPLELWAQYYRHSAGAAGHIRVHPLLHWQEIDVWRYVKRERLPAVSLYFSKGGKRYRSIGCECCCEPVKSGADSIDKIIREINTTSVAERSGRTQDKEKEYMMQKLRSLGYM